MRSSNWRRGSVVGLIVVSMTALIGAVAVSIDVGRIILAAQRCQDVADSAALAGMNNFPSADLTAANRRVADTVTANNVTTGLVITSAAADRSFYTGGASIPGFGTLGAFDEAAAVTTHSNVRFYFAPALGLNNTIVTRTAMVVTASANGTPITPMWVSETTPYNYGAPTELHMADSPCYPGIPGNFGWLTPDSGANDFLTLLKGYNLTASMLAANTVSINDTVYGLPGEKTGQWKQALATDTDSRLNRALWWPWTYDTFDTYHKDNPRLLIIPLCQFLGGSGSGAQFKIVKFGVFWLESVASNGKSITGRFVRYTIPAASHTGGNTGLWTTFLVH